MELRTVLSNLLVVAGLALPLAVGTPGGAADASTGTCHRFVATGGSDTFDGSAQRPFRSLDKLVRSLAPGQVGCIAGGSTYHALEGNGIVRSGGGTQAAPVVITSSGGTRAKVYGQVDIQPAAHDIVLTGIDFVGTHTDAHGNPVVPRATHLNLRGDRLTLRGNSITNPYGICVNAGTISAYSQEANGDPADDLVITGNVVRGCGMSPKLVWEPEMSGAHGIYIVWTRNARITENIIVGNRYRGFQSWPRSEGTLIANNLFDANATHVNLGSALKEGYPWKTTDTIVRDNILVHRTGWVPEKNQAGVVGNFPAGATYGNVVEGNCIDPAGNASAGNGFVFRNNTSAVARFVDRANGDHRLTAGSPCRGKGPASIQPTQATAPAPAATVRKVGFAGGRCSGGRVAVSLPTITSTANGGEWAFHRVDVARWDGRQWVWADTSAPWRYSWATAGGLVSLDGGATRWATHDATRTPSPAGAEVARSASPGAWYAVLQTVWFADGHTERVWTSMAGGDSFCRA